MIAALALFETAFATEPCATTLISTTMITETDCEVVLSIGGNTSNVNLTLMPIPGMYGLSGGANEDVQTFTGQNNGEFYAQIYHLGVLVADINETTAANSTWTSANVVGIEETVSAMVYAFMDFHDDDAVDTIGYEILDWIYAECVQ